MSKAKMSFKVAERLASAAFGPSAQVKRHQDPKHRDRRFAIYYTDSAQGEAGEKGFMSVYVAGHGKDWESAFEMANENPHAQAKSKQIKEKRELLQKRMAEEDAKAPKPKEQEPKKPLSKAVKARKGSK